MESLEKVTRSQVMLMLMWSYVDDLRQHDIQIIDDPPEGTTIEEYRKAEGRMTVYGDIYHILDGLDHESQLVDFYEDEILMLCNIMLLTSRLKTRIQYFVFDEIPDDVPAELRASMLYTLWKQQAANTACAKISKYAGAKIRYVLNSKAAWKAMNAQDTKYIVTLHNILVDDARMYVLHLKNNDADAVANWPESKMGFERFKAEVEAKRDIYDQVLAYLEEYEKEVPAE